MSSNVTVVGNLYADPVMRGEEGSQRCTFSIASEEGTGDNKKTASVNVTAFGALAKNIMNSPGMKKGKSVIVVGRLAGYKKDVVLNGEDKALDMLSVNAFHAGPDLLWQTVEVTKVGSGSSGNSGSGGGGSSSSGGSSGGSSQAASKPSDNPEDF